jgi:vacuolar-type H+-ATPase subunit F/Vma7
MTVAYIGNALDGAAFRLAGARCWVPESDDAGPAFDAACESAEVVFIEPAVANALPRERLDAALSAGRPLTVIIPRPVVNELDPAERVKRLLGLER